MKRFWSKHDDLSDDNNYSSTFRLRNNNIHSVPVYIGLLVILYLNSLIYLVYNIDSTLPEPVTVADEFNNPEAFVAERAIHDLEQLTSFGPRVVGSYENQVLAIDFIKREFTQIQLNAHPNQKLELDEQIVSGSFYTDLFSVDSIAAYTNVHNIVFKLYGANDTKTSILINSHYDSVPTSPGGSDDGINVVAMLEILRKLSKEQSRPLHNIIFLFNGAEETVLQGAHGFITQHKWASECKVVINLEAAGAGGKLSLFQTGPNSPLLVDIYKSVPYPYGRVAGEEIFQSGLIPSDTDFRIFRDFGGLVGVDMAFYKNGYRYHTKFDDFKNIPHGSYQHVGANTLYLIKALANSPELVNNLYGDKMVYYDILGWFMIVYTSTTAFIINICVVILSLLIFGWSIYDFNLTNIKYFKYFSIMLGCILLSILVSGLFIGLVAFIIDQLGRGMSWYATPILSVGLYAFPTVAIMGYILSLINNENISLNIKCQIHGHLERFIWTIVLLVGTILKIRTMYAFMIPILFNSLSFLIIHSFRWHRTIRLWQIIRFVCLFVPSITLLYDAITAMSLFIPLTGRIGSDKNSDLIIGLMVWFFTILITGPYISFIHIVRKKRYCFGFLWLLFFSTIISIFTPWGFPYKVNTTTVAPQRYWLTHSERLFYNASGYLEKTDGGIFFLNFDRNSPYKIRDYVKDLNKIKPLGTDCEKYITCGLPLTHIKMTQIMEHSTWVPASKPTLPFTPRFNSVKEKISTSLYRFNISLTGPDRQYIFISPKDDVKLVNMSLMNDLPKFKSTYQKRPLIYINSISTENPTTFNFSIDLEVPEYFYKNPVVDIVVTSAYVHEKLFLKTPFFVKFLEQFPVWADVTSYIASYASYVL